MKKIVILLVVAVSLSSCSKDEFYSCDKDANLWVKNNLAEIKLMTRADFLAIGDIVYMRAAYTAFSPNQKQALWIGKIEEVLKLDWTEQEYLHIQSILELIKNKSFFSLKDRDPEAFDKEELEIYKWTEYAQEELGWDKKFLYALIATPQEMSADKTLKVITSNLRNLPYQHEFETEHDNVSPDCKCSTTSDWCFWGSMCYWTAKCRRTQNCGTWWDYWCDGMCK